MYAFVYTALYAPVLAYSLLVCIVGFQRKSFLPSLTIILFQLATVVAFAAIIHRRVNNWINPFRFPAFQLPVPKSFAFLILSYFVTEKRILILGLKTFSLAVFYIVLVWNKGRYDHNSFLQFYLVVLIAHAILPYLAVEFMEKKFAIQRNLPISLLNRMFAYAVPYFIFLLPELAYVFYHADAFPVELRLAYYANIVAGLFLLTAMQYTDAMNRTEYLKAASALIFFSIFALHTQAFWIWIAIQLMIGITLFTSGYYRYQFEQE